MTTWDHSDLPSPLGGSNREAHSLDTRRPQCNNGGGFATRLWGSGEAHRTPPPPDLPKMKRRDLGRAGVATGALPAWVPAATPEDTLVIAMAFDDRE